MTANVLVLNQDFQAISVCSVERAFVLVYLRKAELVSDYADRKLHSVNMAFSYPSIIRLYRYVNVPFKKVTLSRQNIYRRDGFRCVYCNDRGSLTLDHVIPRSLGGQDSWYNLVTACQRCNTLKGNRSPEEAGLTMARKPFKPSFIMYLRDFSGRVQEEWKPYLMMA